MAVGSGRGGGGWVVVRALEIIRFLWMSSHSAAAGSSGGNTCLCGSHYKLLCEILNTSECVCILEVSPAPG